MVNYYHYSIESLINNYKVFIRPHLKYANANDNPNNESLYVQIINVQCYFKNAQRDELFKTRTIHEFMYLNLKP